MESVYTRDVSLVHKHTYHTHTNTPRHTQTHTNTLYRSRKYQTPSEILCKSQICPRMEYCCHIWAGACMSSLSSLDRVQRRLRWLIGEELFNTLQPLSHRRDVASLSLFYHYFHGRCSEELHSLVPALRSFPVRTRFAVTAHPYHVDVQSGRTMFHANSFFPRTTAIWNSLLFAVFLRTLTLDSLSQR